MLVFPLVGKWLEMEKAPEAEREPIQYSDDEDDDDDDDNDYDTIDDDELIRDYLLRCLFCTKVMANCVVLMVS